MEQLHIVKIGGNIIDDADALQQFLSAFAALKGNKILVHGGGKLATDLATKMNVPQQMQDGRRITDAETLKIVTMVYAGFINKNIVAQLQACDCDAIGLSGADGNFIRAKKRSIGTVDFGFAGDIVENAVNKKLAATLFAEGKTIAVAPITHDGNGQLLNTNADTIAATLAKAMAEMFETVLIFCFDKKGLLQDVSDENSVLKEINEENVEALKFSNVISAGMLPKVDNAMSAIQNNVKRVVLGHANDFAKLVTGEAGTNITK